MNDDDVIINRENPYDPKRLVDNAGRALLQVKEPEPVTPNDAIKTYTMEEAKSLEIVPFGDPDANPFGTEKQTFMDHFHEMEADGESLATLAREKPLTELALPRPKPTGTVGELLKSLKDAKKGSLLIT